MVKIAMRGNVQKYQSFAWAFSQMKRAIDAEFYIEAVAIAESVISDRLNSFVTWNEPARKPTKGELRLVDLIKRAQALGAKMGPLEPDVVSLHGRLEEWRQLRNRVIHAVAKSPPGTPTMPIEEFTKLADSAARGGVKLAKDVCAWHKRYVRAAVKQRRSAAASGAQVT